MRILISSHAFDPNIGGIETVSKLLAREWARSGHQVRVVTQTKAPSAESFPFEVIRAPRHGTLEALVRDCDIYWHNNLSIRTAWPLLRVRKPWFITHAGSYARMRSPWDFNTWVKHGVVRLCTESIAVSHSMAGEFAKESVVIYNPYDTETFSSSAAEGLRESDLIFVGRFVEEKGVDVLLKALAETSKRGLSLSLSLVGDGPTKRDMELLAENLQIADKVRFLGPKTGCELADLMRRHKILAVPSRYEPFGVVALEGIASGCVVVASLVGGLPEAVGPCGALFPNGAAHSLANTLMELANRPERLSNYRSHAPDHLEKFQPATVAGTYIERFSRYLT